MPLSARLVPWLTLFAVGLVAGRASAESWAEKKKKRDECVQASEDGQLSKVKGQLKAAKEKLLVCTDKACPGPVRKDCEAALEKVEAMLPTIVFGAKDEKGRDLSDVVVFVDGEKLVDSLDGKAVAIDAGKHTVRFEAKGLPAHEEEVVVREGEKARTVVVTIVDTSKPKPAKKKPEPPARKLTTTTLVLGGVGAAALVGAGVVGFVALQKRSSLYDDCGKAGTCSQDDVDSVYRLYDVSYVAAGVGAALIATSAVIYFSTSPEPNKEKAGVTLSPTLGGAVVKGRF